MKRTVIAVVAGLAAASIAHADPAVQLGPWRAWLDSPGGELPFQMQLLADADGLGVVIVNGAEVIELPDVTVKGDEMVIRIPHYDGEIRGVISGDAGAPRIDGTWSRMGRDGTRIEMPFHCESGIANRFPIASGPAGGVSVEGRWRVTMPESGEAVAEFRAGLQPGTVAGAIMEPTGDLGSLEGVLDGRTLRLSTFDGSHAFLFTAEVSEDGTLRGDFYSGPKYHETWTATRDPAIEVSDGFGEVTWNPDVDVWSLTFPGPNGEPRTLEQIVGGKKGLVVDVMGTWCPNCHDQARMVEDILDEIGRPKGLEVVSLAFEYSGDPVRNARQITAYRQRFGITSPIVYAGVAKKEDVVKVLPGLSEMKSFPTTLFVMPDGKVEAVHIGFAGPATGAEYAKVRARFKELMMKMAGE